MQVARKKLGVPKAPGSAPCAARPKPAIARVLAAATRSPDFPGTGRRCVQAAVYAEARPAHADAVAHTAPATAQHEVKDAKVHVIQKFFHAFNDRDIYRMAECVADDCEHCNLAYPSPFRGRSAVVDFYKDFMKVVPENARFEIEDTTGGGGSRNIGVIWHLQLHGTVVPNSTGVSFFRLDDSDRISYVRESPEHFAKIADLAIPSLAVLSPLVELAQPLLRRPGDNSAAPLYSSQAAPGHNPSYSDPGAPRSHYTASQEHRPPAVFPDPMAIVAQAGEMATQQLSNWAYSTPQRESPSPSAARPAPPATPAPPPAQHASADDGMQLTVAEVREQMSKAAVAEAAPRRRPFADAFAATKAPVRSPSMRPLAADPDGPSSSAAAATPVAAPAPAHPAARDDAAGAAEFDALSGVWQKDRALSDVDAYGRCLDLMGVGGLQKTTALGIEGMEVNASAEGGVFEVFYLTPVPFYKVKEAFRLDAETQNGRRDLRSGPQQGRARRDGARAIVDVSWGKPYAGTGHEEYWLDDEGRLCAQSTVTVGEQSATTLQVYRRQSSSSVDSRYYAPQRNIPFGVDANKLSDSILGDFLK